MSNNERFNQMLNQCKHPRQVYNMLAGGAPNIQKLCGYINQQPDPQLEKQTEQKWRDFIARLTAMANERELRAIYSFALHLVRGAL